MKNKSLAILLSASMVAALVACGSAETTSSSSASSGSASSADSSSAAATSESSDTSTESGTMDLSGSTIEVAETYTGDQSTEFQKLVEQFEQETGVTVNVDEYGTDYENTMKTRMANNDLPDVFQTHGWSLLRYKEYLMDLSDQDWMPDLDESALGVIQDDDGKVYVLMISELINGLLVNTEVTDAAGVDIYSIKTWDDFDAACQKVKDAGYTPIGVNSNPGVLANYAGTWVSYEGEEYQDSDKMLDGSWDWQDYRDSVLATHADWINKGYFYDDILTMVDEDLTQRLADNKCAFIPGNDPSVFVTALTLNPDGKYAFLPEPASTDEGVQFVGVGEGDTFGIWKDTENEAAAKAFLEFMAKPENALAMNNVTGKISCLKSTMDIDDSYGLKIYQEMVNQTDANGYNVFYENLWDRKYMPSGMWQIFGNASNEMFDDCSDENLDSIRDYLLENYQDLYEDAQAQ